MRRRITRTTVFLFALLSSLTTFAKDREYYELRTYYFETNEQEARLDQYLKTALLPALHRMKIRKVGVFKPVANDTAASKRIIVLIPFKHSSRFFEMEKKLSKDRSYREAGAPYLDAAHNQPPYKRMETVLLQAFSHMPVSQKPDLKSAPAVRVYELRSYESATEKLYRNKVEMFNEGGEVAIFRKLGFNAVFYGEVLAGCRMPNLMYMTSFENMEARNEHWKSFSADPDWKQLSAQEKYKNNVSKIDIILMRGVDYSDL